MKLSDYVMQFVAAQGVQHVFMLPGGGAMHLNDSLGRNTNLQYVCCLHEQACAMAAEAYARVTNGLGVCLVTCGPGGTNTVTGIAGAWLESTPMLVLAGQVKRADLKADRNVRQLGVQELPLCEIVQPITKYAVTVMDPASIRFHLEKAVHVATSGRPGPVWIEIPLDVQAAPVDPATLVGYNPVSDAVASPRDEDLSDVAEQVIQAIEQASRPVLLVGNGVHVAHGEAVLRQVVETLRIPVLRTWIGADLLPDDHPLCFGKPGVVAGRGANFAIQNSDLLISVGARLDFSVTGYDQTQFARAARKIVVDIDPAELGKLTRLKLDLALPADAKRFLEALLAAASRRPLQANHVSWIERCREWKTRYPVVTEELRRDQTAINTYVFTDLLSEEMADDDVIIPGSSGAAIDTFWLALRLKGQQRSIPTGGLGAMGYGLPAALGGAVGRPGQRVISVDGDGGFQLNIQELATVARLRLPIKFFILNNNGYASIRASQRNYFTTWMACDPQTGLQLPDTCRVAEAYGIPACRVSDPAKLLDTIRQVLASPGPMLAEIMVHPEQPIGPRISSVARPDGSMVSRPLEDLWPFLDRDEFRANMLIEPLPE